MLGVAMNARWAATLLVTAGWMSLGASMPCGGKNGDDDTAKGNLPVAQGVAKAEWVVGWEGARTFERAAAKLAREMSKVLGVTVGVGPWRHSAARHLFVITDVKHVPAAFARRLDGKRMDAFLIQYPVQLDGRDVCLLMAQDREASDFPCYYFLTKYMGVDWVGPNPTDEVLALQPDWKMPDRIDDLQNPDYEERFWDVEQDKEITHEWLVGTQRTPCQPNLWRIFDPTKYADQWDLYPLYGGKRHVPSPKVRSQLAAGWEPCVGNPKAVAIAVRYGLDFLRANPDKLSFSLTLNDGHEGDCMCDLCRVEDSPKACDFGEPFLTDRYVRFDNAVIERVLESNPKAYVAVVSYGRFKLRPVGVKIHPRTLVFNACTNTNDNPDFAQRQREWKAAGAIPCIYQWLWDDGFLTVLNYPHALADIVRLTHDLGGFGYYAPIISVWAASGPKLYVLAHVLWNTKANTDELLSRYMRLAFGKAAAPAMRAYFDRWETVWERGGPEVRYNTVRDWKRISQFETLTRDDLEEMDKDLAQAKACATSANEKQHIGYVDTYYQWLRINADQYLSMRELADESWGSKRTPEEVMGGAEHCAELTERFDETWKNVISEDLTAWLLPAQYHKMPDDFWKSMIEPVRSSVLAMYEPSLDRAFDILTRDLLKTETKEEVMTFWTEQARKHPKLAKWTRTQHQLLAKGPGPNLVVNGGFEDGQPGTPPTIPNWTLAGSWEDIPTVFAWKANSGRNGGHAVAIGRGYVSSIVTTVPTHPGHRYRLSVWYKTSDPRARISGGVPGVSLSFKPVVGEWRLSETTFTAAKGDSTSVKFNADGLNKGQWTWFDDVSVVEICGE
jgi:hypothetical protein